MTTFKDLKAFERRVSKTIAWDDYFTVDGRMYKLYEYGGGSMFHMDHQYAYFTNKRTHDTIYIKYHLPQTNWKKKNIPLDNGELVTDMNDTHRKIEKGHYQLISVEFIPKMELWRTDTL